MELMSSRLFPKNKGASAYQITGVAELCDWVILSDHKMPTTHLVKNVETQPQTIFLSLRNSKAALPFFVDHIFPVLSRPFILITGSEDVTIPNQMDKRWPRYTAAERELWNTIGESPLLDLSPEITPHFQ